MTHSSVTTPHDLVMAVRRAVGSVPGLEYGRTFATPSSVVAGSFETLTVELSGWGPSLHRRRRMWTLPLRTPDRFHRPATTAEAIDAVPVLLAPLLAEQARFAATAHALGIPAPMPIPDHATVDDIRHLHCDRRTLAMLVHDHGQEAALRSILSAVDAVLPDTDSPEEDCIGGSSEGMHLLTQREGEPPTLMTRVRLDEHSHMDAETILMQGVDVPETTRLAMPGRPVSTVFRSGCPVLDDAVIDTAEAWKAGGDGGIPILLLRLRDDMALIGDIVQLR